MRNAIITIVAFAAVSVGLYGAQYINAATDTTLTCEKPIPYTTYGTASGTLEAGYYLQNGPDSYGVLETATSTPYIKTITYTEVTKLGYTPVPLVTKYGQTCNDGTHYKQYDAPKSDFDTYNKNLPPTKTEPISKWQ